MLVSRGLRQGLPLHHQSCHMCKFYILHFRVSYHQIKGNGLCNPQILSIATIGVSIWVLVDSPSFAQFLDIINADFPIYRTGAIILIVISCVVFILTLFGCVGASRESKCMLGTVSDERGSNAVDIGALIKLLAISVHNT